MKRLIPFSITLLLVLSSTPAFASVCSDAWLPHHGLGTLGFAAASAPAFFAPRGKSGATIGLGFEETFVSGSSNPDQVQSGLAVAGRTTGDWGGLGYDVLYRSLASSCSGGRTTANLAVSYGSDPDAFFGFRVGAGPQLGLEDLDTVPVGLGGFARVTVDAPILRIDLELQLSGTVAASEFVTSFVPTARGTLDIPFPVQPYLHADYEFRNVASDSNAFVDRPDEPSWMFGVGAAYVW